jgi:ATP-binding cassette subfamily B (MDR/TAP) protein 1
MSEKKKQAQLSLFKLFRYATKTEVLLNCFGVLNAIIAAAALPLTTLVFSDLVDSMTKWQFQPAIGALITADELYDQVKDKCVYFFYLSAISFVTTYIFMAIFVYTSEASTHRIRKEYLKAVLRQNIAWFDDVGAGEVASRITTDTILINDGIGEKLPMAFYAIFAFLLSFGIAFYRSWKLTLVLLATIPFIAVSMGVTNTINGKFETKILDLYSVSGNIAEETISSVRTVTAFNAQKKCRDLYGNSLGGARKEGIKKSITTGVGLGCLYLFLYNLYALAFYYGHVLVNNDEIVIGRVINVMFAVLIGAFSLGNLAPGLQSFALARGAGAKIFDTLDRVPPIDSSSPNGVKIHNTAIKGSIEFSNCTFRYPARPDVTVLKSFSLKIKPGTTVALVGESGSGKSTIIKLVERFYDPDSGYVTLDGYGLKDMNVANLRHHIGLVSQEPVLFEGTVLDNVLQGLSGSPFMDETDFQKRRRVEDACMQANAHEFIMQLPQGYDTEVGERGMLLSGGQKQRVAIARAIIKDPKILLLGINLINCR